MRGPRNEHDERGIGAGILWFGLISFAVALGLLQAWPLMRAGDAPAPAFVSGRFDAAAVESAADIDAGIDAELAARARGAPDRVIDGVRGVLANEGPNTAERGMAAGESARDALSARFGFCSGGGGRNCVVDGDTFWFEGRKIRVADIDTPETHPPRCAAEAARGRAATQRLHALLNAGPFTLERIDRDTDRYGRALRIVTRGGASLGDQLVGEGLARHYAGGHRAGWC